MRAYALRRHYGNANQEDVIIIRPDESKDGNDMYISVRREIIEAALQEFETGEEIHVNL